MCINCFFSSYTSTFYNKVLISVTTICHVRKVSLYIPLSVKTSTTSFIILITYIMCSLGRVFVFMSKLSVTLNFLLCFSLMLILVAILLNTFAFSQSVNFFLVFYIITIIPFFSLIYSRFYTNNGGSLIYCIAQYKYFL